MQPAASIQPATSLQQPTLFDEVTAAAYGTDGVALGDLRRRIGFDALDGKGRLALIQAMRREVKGASVESHSRTSALQALEAAFPTPYKALKERVQRKAQAEALKTLAGLAQLPELPVELLPKVQGLEEIASAALPEHWVRLRAHNGVLDVPRDTFGRGSYFDTLINGEMQGGRDAAGAHMVDVDIDVLRAIVHFATHDELPAVSAEQRVALRTQADAFCMTDLVSSLDAPRDLRSPMERFSTAQQQALILPDYPICLARWAST